MTLCINCPVVGYYVVYVFGEISRKVSNHINSLGNLGGASCSDKLWKPPFPVLHNVWSILSTNGVCKVECYMEKYLG